MKAFLLAAGYGTRLRPLTDTVPKCLVPICGKPLLGRWFELFLKHGVTEVLVNTHYLPEKVREYIDKYNKEDRGLYVREFYEAELLGSGGTIRENRAFVENEESFLICYSDNLTDADLTDFRRFHGEGDCLLSMALFYTDRPKQCGIAELDGKGRVISFEEKPERPRGNLANAGLYITDGRIFDHLDPKKPVLDFGKDVLPRLVGDMRGWLTKGYLKDIGTPENYRKANEDWEHGHN